MIKNEQEEAPASPSKDVEVKDAAGAAKSPSKEDAGASEAPAPIAQGHNVI